MSGPEDATAPAPAGSLSNEATGFSLPLLRKWLLTLAIGSAGGFLFSRLHLPLAWMMGALWVTMPLTVLGWRLGISRRLREVMMSVLGFLVGSGFTPALIAFLPLWSISLTGLFLNAVLLTFVVQFYLRRATNFSRVTAMFAAFPGGQTQSVFIGEAYGADGKSVAIVHSTRILIVALIIPTAFQLVVGLGGEPLTRITTPLTWEAVLLLIGTGAVGLWVGTRLRLPMPYMLGPMLISSLIHLTGLTEARSPTLLINAAQVVMGCAIGTRFAGISFRSLLRPLIAAVGSSLAMLVVCAGMAYGVSRLTGLPFPSLLLAFAPGGLPEMTVIAVSLGSDLALVSSHHLIRVLLVAMLSPLIVRMFPEWFPRAGGSSQGG